MLKLQGFATPLELPHGWKYFQRHEIEELRPRTRRNHGANITFRHHLLSPIRGLMGPTDINGNDLEWRSLRTILERRQIRSHGRLDSRRQGRTRWQRWETTIQPELQRYSLKPHIYIAIYLLCLNAHCILWFINADFLG